MYTKHFNPCKEDRKKKQYINHIISLLQKHSKYQVR